MAKTTTSAPSAPSSTADTVRKLAVKYYLPTYNVLSACAWFAVFVLTLNHLLAAFFGDVPLYTAIPAPPTAAQSKSFLGQFIASFSPSPPPPPVAEPSILPSWVIRLLERAETTHAAVGCLTKIVQTFAVLEVVHASLGWVKSDLRTTAMQVASRLFTVWVVVDQFPATQSNALYASMVLSWCITEVIRYAFYASALLAATPRELLYLRYSTFYVLYPTGAASEALLNLATLPLVALSWRGVAFPGAGAALQAWGWTDYARLAVFAVWWPALYVMYTHMIRLRSKVLATGPTLSANGPAGDKLKAQ